MSFFTGTNNFFYRFLSLSTKKILLSGVTFFAFFGLHAQSSLPKNQAIKPHIVNINEIFLSNLSTHLLFTLFGVFITLLIFHFIKKRDERILSNIKSLEILEKGIQQVTDGKLEMKLAVEDHNDVSKLLLSFNDMTQSLQSYKEQFINQSDAIKKQADSLSNANSELNEYAHTVAHDLKAPLRMVTSYAKLLQKRCGDQLDEQAHEYLKYTIDGTNRMRRIVEDLLEYAQFDKKYYKKSFASINLSDALACVLQDLALPIQENQAQVIIHNSAVIQGNPSLIHLLFQNLIVNAIKYRREEAPKIEIRVEEKNEEFLITVVDNGEGIEKQYWEEIFKPFKRLVSQYEVEGNGIGLSTVKKIVQHHNGQIWLESQVGLGSTFYISLPKSPQINESKEIEVKVLKSVNNPSLDTSSPILKPVGI